jgi:hypothetical protein
MAIWVNATCNRLRVALRWLIGFIGVTEWKTLVDFQDSLTTSWLFVRMKKLNGGYYRLVFSYLAVILLSEYIG